MALPQPSRAYACVYLHRPLRGKLLREVEARAKDDADVDRYLEAYAKEGSVLDWGDDPSFFCAEDADLPPSWGVCRRDVRASLQVGDFVVFVCGRSEDRQRWDYHLTGVGTIAHRVLVDQRTSSEVFRPYADFFNVLARMTERGWVQYERAGNHTNWRERMGAPYLVFESDSSLSAFDLRTPHHLATYRKGVDDLEMWDDHDVAHRVRRILGLRIGDRGLRTRSVYRPHAKFRIREEPLTRVRRELIDVVRSGMDRGCANPDQ